MDHRRHDNFALIQALRGLAALWVVLFHLNTIEAITGFTSHLPDWVTYLVFSYGSAGVAVFFVLSGFVIAHSLEGKSMTGRELGKFVARRSMRLDLPYWASMLLMVGSQALMSLARREVPELPGGLDVLAHLLYLQDILGLEEIQLVYWTLAYEVQFYLVFVGGLWLSQKWGMARPVFWIGYALAFCAAFAGREWAVHGLFANLWHGFFLGVLAYRAGYLREPVWLLLVLIVVTIVCQKPEAGIFAVPCALTAGGLMIAARTGFLLNGLRGAGWKALGTISYSLYLVHMPVLHVLGGTWRQLMGRGVLQDTGAMLVLLAGVILAAAIMYFLIERPSHQLARHLFRRGLVELHAAGSTLPASQEAVRPG